MANAWSQRSKKYGSAIIVFKLSDDAESPSGVEWFSNSKGQRLLEGSDDWNKAVMYFRNGQDRRKADITRQRAGQLSRYDYLFGPIARDGRWRMRGNPTPQLNPEDAVEYQLCIKTQDSADTFYNEGRNIQKVIFFPRCNTA